MPTNVVQFNQELAGSVSTLKLDTIKLHRRQTLAFVEIAAQVIPIDTGHAQANIVASIDVPNETENNDEPLTPRLIRNRAASVLRRLRFGAKVFVNFNAPYTSFLNEGSSQQAPAGFIEQTEATVNATFR